MAGYGCNFAVNFQKGGVDVEAESTKARLKVEGTSPRITKKRVGVVDQKFERREMVWDEDKRALCTSLGRVTEEEDAERLT